MTTPHRRHRANRGPHARPPGPTAHGPQPPAHHGGRAFTLIEVMVSLALGTMLLLIAVAVFRTATTAMSELNQLADENGLIRAGYFTATEEADTWRAHADPSYPYLAGHLIEASEAGAEESIHGVRPFMPVTWESDLDDPRNPHWRQIHDPRTWYRGYIHPNQTTKSLALVPLARSSHAMPWDEWDNIGNTVAYAPVARPWIEFISRHTDTDPSLPEMRPDVRYSGWCFWMPDRHEPIWGGPHFSGSQKARGSRTRGWQMWHLVGDYAMLANVCGFSIDRDGATYLSRDGDLADPERTCDADLDGDGTVAAGEADPMGATRHDYPQNFLTTFENLGLLGCMSYLPPGTPNLAVASSVNLRDDRIEDRDYRVRRGEIPFMHQTTAETLNHGTSTAPQGLIDHPVTNRNGDLPYDVTAIGRANYHAMMPTIWDRFRASYKVGPIAGTMCDFDSILGSNPWITNADFLLRGQQIASVNIDGNSSMCIHVYRHTPDYRTPLTAQGLFYPASPRLKDAISGEWDEDLLKQTASNPAYPLELPDPATSFLDHSHGDRLNMAEVRHADQHLALHQIGLDSDHHENLRERFVRTTWHVPINHTDDPRPRLAGGSEGGLTMSTRIYRYRVMRCDHAELTVTVGNPARKKDLVFKFNVFTTDYRGARQYWGRNSAAANAGAGIKVDPGDPGSQTFLIGDHYR